MSDNGNSTVLVDLYRELKQFSHLQQLHSVLSADVRSCRERVLKETKSVRRELTFYRWCQRRRVSEAYPFPRGASANISRGLDYDRLVFYRKLISYLHSHPVEFSSIIVSLSEIKNEPNINSLEYLYFNREHDLAECIAFDIMMTDINSLTLLLRSILLKSAANNNIFNTLSQKLFQLFIIITCHKLINTTFRSLLNRLYRINDKLSFQSSKGKRCEIQNSSLYASCDDVLSVMICFLRILPHPLRHCISIMTEEGIICDVSSLLEWLLSRIFSPLLLAPDDWYLVICNPAADEITNNNNIQSIVTTLLQLCRVFPLKKEKEKDDDDEDVEITHLLLEKHNSTLQFLLNGILKNVMDKKEIIPSRVLVPSNATPELFIWHKIFLQMISDNNNGAVISDELRSLCCSILPPRNISFRPWITIQLPSNESFDGNDDDILCGTPRSQYLSPLIFKPIRVFLLSLSSAQCLSIRDDIFTSDIVSTQNDLNLSTQQMTLLNEARDRCDAKINSTLTKLVEEYRDSFCKKLFAALSTHNVLSSLNYIKQKEETLKELRQIFIESHENLQMRDILSLSKKRENLLILRLQIEKILYSFQQQTISSIDDASDWTADKFVVFRSAKCISKTRNALIRFLNDYGIGRVDFKVKFGGAVLDFTNKRISRILVNAIIFEIKDIFWNRCAFEDAKFKFQCAQMKDKYGESLSVFLQSFLNKKEAANNINLSAQTLSFMIDRMRQINNINVCQTIGDFEDIIADVRDSLCTAINGASCADGDDYMPLFCYILMKSIPQFLPSQLQTTKVISQRKFQDKCFIDCCVAMKALRNFCNVTFAQKNVTDLMLNNLKEPEPKAAEAAVPPNITPPPVPSAAAAAIATDKQSIFETIKAKLPTTQNNQSSQNKKGFFNLSPSHSFSSFINKNSTQNNGNDDNGNSNSNTNHNNEDSDIMVKVHTKL